MIVEVGAVGAVAATPCDGKIAACQMGTGCVPVAYGSYSSANIACL